MFVHPSVLGQDTQSTSLHTQVLVSTHGHKRRPSLSSSTFSQLSVWIGSEMMKEGCLKTAVTAEQALVYRGLTDGWCSFSCAALAMCLALLIEIMVCLQSAVYAGQPGL